MTAVATAANDAVAGAGGSPQAQLDGFHAAIAVSVIAAALGVLVTVLPGRARRAAAPEPEVEAVLEETA